MSCVHDQQFSSLWIGYAAVFSYCIEKNKTKVLSTHFNDRLELLNSQ